MCFITASGPKRFYKNSSVLYSGNNQYEITLDNRKLKTPNGGQFLVRSEPLAIAIAAEWNAQKENIDRSKMHLVASSANTTFETDQWFHFRFQTDRPMQHSHWQSEPINQRRHGQLHFTVPPNGYRVISLTGKFSLSENYDPN